MSDKIMKGQSTQLLMFSVVIVGVGVGLLSFAQMLAAPGILASSLDDPPMVVEAQTQSDNIVAHFLPLAAHYSVAQGAWNESTNPENILTNGTFDNHYSWTLENASTRSNQVLDKNYIRSGGSYNVDRCNIEIPPKEIRIYKTSTNVSINKSNESDPLVRTECSNGRNQVVNVRKKPSSQNTTIPNIRLHKLLIITLNGTKAAYDNAVQDENNDRYYGSETHNIRDMEGVSACMSSKSDAKDRVQRLAVEKAQNNIGNLLNPYKQDYNDKIDNMGETDSSGGGGLLSGVIDFINPWSPDDSKYDWIPSILSNSTYLEQKGSIDTSKCGCQGQFICGGSKWNSNNPNKDASNWVSKNRNKDAYPAPDCEHVNEGSTAECTHEDGVKSGGDCNRDAGGQPNPECSSGSFNGTACAGSPGTDPECNPPDGDGDGDGDTDWEYDDINNDCRYVDGSIGDPVCTKSGVEHDGSGGCEPIDPRPIAYCPQDKITYSAEAEYYWELESFEFGSVVKDLQSSIPVRDGWKNLYMNRTFNYSFPEGDRP